MDINILKINTVQIFTHGPRNTRANNINYNSINKYCSINKIKLFVHSSYLTTGIWNITDINKNSQKSKTMIRHLSSQLGACKKMGSCGLVIHLPKKVPIDILKSLNLISSILNKYKVDIILEIISAKPDGDKTYETPKKINNLYKHIKHLKYWSLCVDTAHLWSAGINVGSSKVMNNWLGNLIKPSIIKLFHINGSSNDTFGTGSDRHIIPFSKNDDIWGVHGDKLKKINKSKLSKSSFSSIIKFTKIHKIPIIYEINRGSFTESQTAVIILKTLL